MKKKDNGTRRKRELDLRATKRGHPSRPSEVGEQEKKSDDDEDLGGSKERGLDGDERKKVSKGRGK